MHLVVKLWTRVPRVVSCRVCREETHLDEVVPQALVVLQRLLILLEVELLLLRSDALLWRSVVA